MIRRVLGWLTGIGRSDRVQAALAAVFLPSVLFLASLNNILKSNDDELYFQPLDYLGLYGAFVVLALALYFCIVRAPRSATARALVRLALALGVLLLIFNVTQETLHQSPFWLAVTADAVALASVAAVAMAAPLRRLIAIFAAIGLLIFATGVFDHARIASRALWRQARIERVLHPKPASAEALAAAPEVGNVYHIVLDSFQSDAYDLLLESGVGPLPEFTYFKEFRTNYGRTHFSMPSILLGELYDGRDDILDWNSDRMRQDGILRALHDAKVTLRQHPYYLGYCAAFTNFCYSQTRRTQERQSFFVAVDLHFQSLLPESLRRVLAGRLAPERVARLGEAASLGFSLSRHLWPEAAGGENRFVPMNVHPYFSVTAFERFLDSLADVPASGQYLFFHAILPHGPYVYDRACNFTYDPGSERLAGGAENVVPVYLEQARCANLLVERLVARLKELGRFEDTLIVVHSDHGHHLVPAADGQLLSEQDAMEAGLVRQFRWNRDPSEEWPQEIIDGTSKALLLIKFPRAASGGVSLAPAQGIDIAPTILAHFGIETAALAGAPLQTMSEDADREVLFFANTLDYPDHLSKYRLEGGAWRFVENVEVVGGP